jgi:hypothetical protein
MKYFTATICVVVLIVFFGSCKKDVASHGSITGTWELRQAQNGMVPTIDYPAGNGNILIFSGSGYEKYTNGNLVKSGQYTLVSDASAEASVGLVIPQGQFTTRIIFDNDLVSPKTFIEKSSNKLTLLSGYFPLDGGSHLLYERIEDRR